MSPEIYFDKSIKRPEIHVKLLPGESSEALDLAQMAPINYARNELEKINPNFEAAQEQLSGVIGEEGASKLIEAHRKRKSFRIQF